MMQSVPTAAPAGSPARPPQRNSARGLARHRRTHLAFCLTLAISFALHAQNPQPTGPQQLAFAGLRAVANQGQINALRIDAQGNLYLLLDQKDGVRLLKTDPTATNILAQAQLGAKGDVGLALALDPIGNLYVTGTTTSGALNATPGAAFPSASSSFVAKLDANLKPLFVTFTGGASMSAVSISATADAVFITGSIFSATLPVTPAAILQTPAYGSTQNGFVEKFSSNGSTLLYATYLTGANGSSTPTSIAADASDNVYIAGTTTSSGYPTLAALVPEALGATSDFLTKLTPAGDGITFSTYIPGTGITSLAIDPIANNLLLSGSISLGQFPIATVSTPLSAISYQSLLRLSLDGSTVLASTLLAPGSQSFVATGPAGTAWVVGTLTQPLLPLTPISPIGNAFALRVNAAGLIDQTARFGGIATSNPTYAGAPVTLTTLAVDANGNPIVAGSFTPFASQSLLSTETFDLPLASAPTSAFPSTVRAAVLPPSACNGSLCAGSAAYLAKLTIPSSASAATASLALSVDDAPNLTLRNLGSAEATNLQLSITGFTSAANCATTLPAGGECSIALTGSGPGILAASATNTVTQTQILPALTANTAALPIVFSPKELDFGIVSSASGPITRTITVTNLTQQSQIFTSTLDISTKTTLPYSIAETTSDCTLAGATTTKLLAPGGVCHITLGLTASNSPLNDGPIQQSWLIGARDVQLTAYAQASALSLSASEIDFGTQYTGGLRLPRYLYLSNNSTTAIEHSAVTLPATSPFSLTDACPNLLEAFTVCQLKLAYQAAHTPSADSVTLSLDHGLTALVTGRTLPQPSANGVSVNPNLAVSATSLTFANAVPVTNASSTTQTLTIQNTGASAFALSLTLTGDFSDATICGPTLAGGATCSVVLTFAPSQPGTRAGLLSITAGAGTTPIYVTLSGIGTGILAPTNNGTLNFSGVLAGQPTVQWIKVTQPFTTFAAATASTTLGSPFAVLLVEDIGYGHGQPPSTAFTTNTSGTCLNCWLGVQFTPPTTGPIAGTLTLTSSTTGNPYVLSLTGNGLPLTGLLLTPVAQDFGPVPINNVSAPMLFTLTNLIAGGASIPIASPTLTGDFALSSTPTGGAPCTGTLAYTASCFLQITFAPTAAGPRTGTLTFQSGSTTATASLTGYGAPDPGVALNPSALIFNNVPGAASSQQTITLTNTSASADQIGTPIASSASFTATTTCATLAPAAACSITVSFTPATAPSSGTLNLPVTTTLGGASVQTTYTVPLTGAYTTEDAGLQIISADAEYGPQSTGALSLARQFTINNLTAKSLALSIALPRQFVLTGPPCSGLAPNATCNFSVAFLPLANGDITGTLFAQGTPTDGSATLNGLGYVEGYGLGPASLSITGSLLPGNFLSFGQIPSGQSAQRTLTLTNTSPTTHLTVRRVTSEWPFLSTTTCGTTLAPSASCTVTLTYTPIHQIATGSSSAPSSTDSSTLVIESDAASSPDLIDLTGSSTPVTVTSPTNTAPIAAFTPSQSSLTFADTSIGASSAPQTVALSNTGTATLTIFGIQTTPDFTTASNCSTLVPGASCTLTVTFTPQNSTQSGTRASAIEISSNASTSLEFISVVGISNLSNLTLTPASLNFGTLLVSATATLPLQLSNTGSSAATLLALTATGDYTVANGSCPSPGSTLAAGATCALQVTFAPIQSGTRTGTLSLATSATSLPLTVPLTGVGIQSHLLISPASLSFGSIPVASSASLSLTLANTGTAPITGIALAITGDYAITAPCALTTLAPGSSCSITLTFAPTAAATRPGTLTVTSSDPTSPATVSLTGSGILAGSFTLTTPSASATVSSGTPATYTLTLTPLNNFTGTVVLNCTPILAATYADCSLLPSSISLASTAQTSVATLNTVASIAAIHTPTTTRSFPGTVLALLFPAIIFTWKARTSPHRAWHTVGPIAWAIFASIALLTAGGCASNNITPSNLRYTPAGTYQYQVTASSTAGAPVTQTVTLTLIVK